MSNHPGKFGFVALHNILTQGYEGGVYGTNLEGGEVLGVPMVTSIDELPADAPIDLVFVCTPAAANVELLRACGRRGIGAAFLTSAGYGEAGDAGRRRRGGARRAGRGGAASCSPGPNGQGVVSTPVGLCAQIVAPYPPPGRIAIASQSGNFVSSFQNFSVATGVGVSRAVSAGNAAALTVPDFLEYYAADPETAVALAYVEGIGDGRRFFERVRGVTDRKPLVLLKGGATAGGQRAAASHTGALATDDRVFDGMCRAGRHHTRRHGRGGVRRRGDVRDPAAPAWPARRGRDDGRRLGSGHRRRDRRARSSSSSRCPTTCGPRSTRSSRPAGAATTRSTSPGPRRVTRSPRCWSWSRAIPTSTR